MGLKSDRSAAVELSIGTIVIIVLAMSMLILGMVLVRSIMCGAIGMTGNINTKVNGEINNLFEATGAEVACIGAGEDPVALIPDKSNNIYCSVKAPETAEYTIKVVSGGLKGDILSPKELANWVIGDDFLKKNIAPGDDTPQKFLLLKVPSDAPSDTITIDIEVWKTVRNGSPRLVTSPRLTFEIRRVGIIRAAVC